MEVLTLKNLSFQYPEAADAAVKDVSFSVSKGEFIVLCGATGSGKSTLMRLLKLELIPLGQMRGEIAFDGIAQKDLSDRDAAEQIAYVMQHPEQQIVTDKVWHELAFGLENLGYSRQAISSRVAEMACYFGIENWFDRAVDTLSGGQKQLLNLASVMTMHPKILLLDEPTAQLDPIAASNFIRTLYKLNRELSLTVIIAEHRLEELLTLCDRVLVMDGGRLVADTHPRGLAHHLPSDAPLLAAMPGAVRVFRALEAADAARDCPLDEREGRAYLERNYRNDCRSLPHEPKRTEPERGCALELKEAFFRYERNTPDVLRGMSLTVYEGESLCLLGGNGAGKTTLLGVLSGVNRCYSGRVRLFGKDIRDYRRDELYRGCVALLPQDVQTILMHDTVREELTGCEEAEKMLPYDFSRLYDRHPYDLSGGEQQLVLVARAIAQQAGLIIMDEPTSSLDYGNQLRVLEQVKGLVSEGYTVLLSTHNPQHALSFADSVLAISDGTVAAMGSAHEVLTPDLIRTLYRIDVVFLDTEYGRVIQPMM